MNKKLAVGYCRVSTKKQEKTGLSLEAQEDYIREWGHSNGCDLIKIFRAQESGSGRERHHLMDTFRYCLKNGIKDILITDTDRWTRDRRIDMEMREFLEKNDLTVHIIREGKTIPHFDNPDDEFIHNVKADFSDVTRKKIREKILIGLKKKLKKCEYPGVPPLGYKSIRKTDSSPQKLIQTESAPQVKQLLEAFASGKFTIRQAIRFAKDTGLKPVKIDAFNKVTLGKIIKSRFYYGDFSWTHPWINDNKPVIYKNKTDNFVALISKEIWQQNQDILEKRQINCKGKSTAFRFNSLLSCGICGRVIFGEKFDSSVKYRTKKGMAIKNYNYQPRYHCTKGTRYAKKGHAAIEHSIPPEYVADHVDKDNLRIKKAIIFPGDGEEEKTWLKEGAPLETHTCEMPSFWESELEEMLLDEIRFIKFNKKTWAKIKEKIFRDDTKDFLDYEIRTLRTEATKNETKLDRMYNDYCEEVIDADFFESRSKKIRKRQNEVKERLAELEEDRETYDEQIGKSIRILDSFRNWEKIFKDIDSGKATSLLKLLTIKISTTLRHSPARYDETKIKALNITFTPEVEELFMIGLLEMDSKRKLGKLDKAFLNSLNSKYSYSDH